MADPADVIYVGAEIVTIHDANPTAQALAVRGGRITAVGGRTDVVGTQQGPATKIIDLGGATLLPGFIDPHSHYINSLSVANQVNVFAPPAGPGADVAAIVAVLRKFRDSHPIPPGEMLVAYGYDDTIMPNGRTLSYDDLDADFPDTPAPTSASRRGKRSRRSPSTPPPSTARPSRRARFRSASSPIWWCWTPIR